jgi:hypothetical protein
VDAAGCVGGLWAGGTLLVAVPVQVLFAVLLWSSPGPDTQHLVMLGFTSSASLVVLLSTGALMGSRRRWVRVTSLLVVLCASPIALLPFIVTVLTTLAGLALVAGGS